MPSKANADHESSQSPQSGTSGKLVILGVVAIATVAAAASWWFRYKATHRAAEFWGSEDARLIRDAPIVEMYEPARDISAARGLVHLRNALLEDRSFQWPSKPVSPDVHWKQGLI